MTQDERKHHKVFIDRDLSVLRWHWWLTPVTQGYVMKRVARFIDDKITISVYSYPNVNVSLSQAAQVAREAKQALKGK